MPDDCLNMVCIGGPSEGLLKSLNKSNMLQQFQEVFDNFVKEGIFQELTKEEMKAKNYSSADEI